MVNLVTRYDKVLNEKTFMLKGDEAYARTTDTLLKVIRFPDSLNHLNGMRVGLSIDVLRDIGDSTVVLYDNDEVIGVYNWNHAGWGHFSQDNFELEVNYLPDSTQLTSRQRGIAWYLYNKLIKGDFTVELELSHQEAIRLSCTGSQAQLNQIGTIQVSTGNPNNSTNTVMYVPQDNVFYNVKYERVGGIINCYLMVDNEWVLCSTRPITTAPVYFGFFIYQAANTPFNKKINFKNLTIKQNNQIIFADKGGLNTNNFNKLNIGSEEDLNSGLWLGYDMEHNIYAKYMGNKKCLKSQSKTESFMEPTPDKYLTNIMFINPPINHDSNTNVDFQLRIQSCEYCVLNKSVKIYVDNQLHSTVSVPPNGLKHIKLSGLNDSKHVIRAVFEGDDESTASDVSFEFSVGYQVRFVKVPPVLTYNEDYEVVVEVKNYLNNLIPNASVNFIGVDSNFISFANGVTNNNGVYSCNFRSLQDDDDKNYLLKASSGGSESNTHNLKTCTIYDINYANNYKKIIVDHQINHIQGYFESSISDTGEDLSNIPIKLTGDVNQTVYSDENGGFSVDYIGTGKGPVSITSTVGGKSNTLYFDDAIQYWNLNQALNQMYSISGGTLTKLTNGYKLQSNNNNAPVMLNLRTEDFNFGFDWEVIFQITDASPVVDFRLGTFNTYNVTPLSLKYLDIVKIVKKGSVLRLYVNNIEKASHALLPPANVAPSISFEGNTTHYLLFRMLEFIKIP